MKRNGKSRRNPYASMLFDNDLPYGHKVEINKKKTYKRNNKHKKRIEDESSI